MEHIINIHLRSIDSVEQLQELAGNYRVAYMCSEAVWWRCHRSLIADALKVRSGMGMVFQGAALFDSMTVFENVAYPLREHTDLDENEIEARVREKLEFVDLDADRVMPMLPAE